MKLKQAVEMGLECGLGTIEEAIENVVIHSLNLFPYSEFNKQIDELLIDVRDQGYLENLEAKLKDYIPS